MKRVKKGFAILKVGNCFWAVSIKKFISRFSYQLSFSIITDNNNSCNWLIHTRSLYRPVNILILIWIKNFMKVYTYIWIRFKTKPKHQKTQELRLRKKIIFGVCLLFPFDVFRWNENSAIHFIIISFDSDSDNAIFYLCCNCEPKTWLSFI